MRFVRIKFNAVDAECAMNVDAIRAAMPAGSGTDRYHLWLESKFQIPTEIAKRIAQLGGVVPMENDYWEVTSPELTALCFASKQTPKEVI